MWHGKPVIATGYSGNLDYMTPQNTYLVDLLGSCRSGRAASHIPADGEWAEPDVEHAARLMREVFERRDEAARRGERAAADIRASHAPEAAGRAMADRLEVVMASPTWRSERRGIGRSAAVYTGRLEDRIRSGPVPARRRHIAVQRAVRNGAVSRCCRPLTAHQRQINEDMLERHRGRRRGYPVADPLAQGRRHAPHRGARGRAAQATGYRRADAGADTLGSRATSPLGLDKLAAVEIEVSAFRGFHRMVITGLEVIRRASDRDLVGLRETSRRAKSPRTKKALMPLTARYGRGGNPSRSPSARSAPSDAPKKSVPSHGR